MYVVLQLNKQVEISVGGRELEVPLSYAEGMVGTLPVFSSKELAKLFAGDKYGIREIAVCSFRRNVAVSKNIIEE